MTEISDPFRIDGPAIVSFSGGRTSGYMLWRILQAHDGTLPEGVAVCFANTGREMPATLDFVRDCAAQWSVPIRWLEYRWEPGRHSYAEVSHNSASRDGEPFEQLLAARSALPNPVQRACTAELKIRTMKRLVQAEFHWEHWTNIVGLRADEAGRVFRATRDTKDRWTVICPLHTAGVVHDDVMQFWKLQPFDLRLAGPWEGNCDGCFLKSRGAVTRMLEDHPARMAWWRRMEAMPRGGPGVNRLFRSDRESYAQLTAIVARQGRLPFNVFEPEPGCTEWACTD